MHDGHEYGGEDCGDGEPANDASGFLLQARSTGVDAGERASDACEFGMRARAYDLAQTVTRGDERAAVERVLLVGTARHETNDLQRGSFVDRKGLTRQQ